MWVVEIDLISVRGIELDLISVSGSELNCFFAGVEKYLVLVYRNSFGFCIGVSKLT